MLLRAKILLTLIVASGGLSLYLFRGGASGDWIYFSVYLVAVLLSSGMKVGMPNSDGTMSVNFPFIFLGIIQLSPMQALLLAMMSVLAQCRFKVLKPFTLVQIVFNVSNVITATALARVTYSELFARHIAIAPSLTCAAVVYFLANTIPVALIIAWDLREAPYTMWRNNFTWYLPFYLVGAMLAFAADIIGERFGWLTSLLLIPMVYTIFRAYNAQMAIIRDREQHAIDTEELHLRTIEGLAMAIEAKDQNTHRHLMRVRVYVSELGKMLKLEHSMMQALLTASFLHDIGKLAVPEHIINKPGKLTFEEFEKMKIHPVVGADILERVRFPYPVVPIVRSHHEAWDGSGYPDGLKGTDIPIGARLLSVVDCFDALASERPYRKPLPLNEAMDLVRSKAGIHFDPEIVALLDANYLQLEEMARQQIHDMAPLNVDLVIARGLAPGAGFAPTQAESIAAEKNSKIREAAGNHQNSLNLIAAASREARTIFELGQVLGSSLSARETSSMMSTQLRLLIPFNCFAVYIRQDEFLTTQYMDGELARAFTSQLVPMGEGLSGWVAENQRPIINGNPTVEPHYIVETGLFTATSSAISIPLFNLDGSVLGALSLYAEGNAAFHKDHLRILQATESKFSLSLQNALRFRSAESDANVDHLTQLGNMRHFFQKLDAQIEIAQLSMQSFALVVCDLNSFKAVNDRHGHLVGNDLLKLVAKEFRQCCRDQDTVVRMGGDEFVFLFPAMDGASTAACADMLEKAVQRACIDLKLYNDVSVSIGLASYPADGENAEQLLGVADRKMYRSKRAFHGSRSTDERSAVLEPVVAV
ncbi:HD domain-containing phosphohydrolase [Granulicella aggregans]|uniref:HD domain-containing phosphohydrolase n=1 Tax=Granulicella aggregans TaxID=474949 RepID=UPI0021DF7108|nr:HD domain-containing phosphohydrolase [Granulicella aggregans]